MKRPKWPGLERRVSRHGKVCWYVRVEHGPRVRLKCEPGTLEWRKEYEDAYAALVKGETPVAAASTPEGPVGGTLAWAWELYRKSSAWTGLSNATRRQRENIMKNVLKGAGDMPLAKLSQTMVIAGREHRKDTPSQANNYLNTLRHFCAWAKKNHETTHVKVDPTLEVENVKRPKTKGFPEWTEEDVETFIKRWPLGTPQYLALSVHLYTGLRRGDAVRLGRQHFKKGVIHLPWTEKTKTPVTIPVHPKLAEAIKACPPKGLHILENSYARPWVKESYGNTFHDWAVEAGVPADIDTGKTKNSHGIRKAAAMRLAEAGATEAELMAIFAWSDPAMARLYTKAANAKRLAMQGVMKDRGYAEVTDLFNDVSDSAASAAG